MAIALDLGTYTRSVNRIVYRSWVVNADGQADWSPWTPLLMSQRIATTTATNGFVLGPWSRRVLPMVGEARFYYRFGTINGVKYGPLDSLGNQIPPDLRRAEIRIQSAPAPSFTAGREEVRTFAPAWRTVWAGTVENIEIDPQGGVTTYYCFDGFYRARRWQMTNHHVYYNSVQYRSRSHPGFNVAVDGYYARVQGNKDPTNATDDPYGDIAKTAAAGLISANRYYAHSYPDGTAAKWTDQQAVEAICMGARGRGEPCFEMRGQTQLFSAGISSWPVQDGAHAWGLVAGICDRRRGRGAVFFDWEDDVAAPLGPLNVCLRVRPQTLDDLTYTPPGGSLTTLPGATSAGTSRAIDLSGDQRLQNGSLKFGDRLQYKYDYIESLGEYIEVLVTLAGIDSTLDKRWAAADTTAFAAVTVPRRRATARWDPVWQRYGIPTNWTWAARDGDGGTLTRCDYFCDDSGTIVVPVVGNGTVYPYASPLVTTILPDLPLYEGWNYTANPPVRYDGASDVTAPPRRRMLGLVRTSSNLYLDLSRIGFSLTVDPTFGVLVQFGPDQDENVAGRFFSQAGVPGFAYDWTKLILSVGLRTPNRVRTASGDTLGNRKLSIIHHGLHLWLAHPGAIWDLDRSASAVAEAPALRNTAGSVQGVPPFTLPTGTPTVPGVLRDDRQALIHLHTLACVWYLRTHRTATWALRTNGFLPSFTDTAAGAVGYLKLGEVVPSVTYTDRLGAATTITTEVPCTGIDYDPETDTTKWTTDWNDLDFVSR